MTNLEPRRTLGIALSAGRLGFAVVDEDRVVLDHAVWDFARSQRPLLWVKLERIVSLYEPQAAIFQDLNDSECELGRTSHVIICGLAKALKARSIPVHSISKTQVRRALGCMNGATKDELARLVAQRFDDIAHLRPRPRGLWRSEHRNMCRFVAFGLIEGFFSSFSLEADDTGKGSGQNSAA